MERDTERILNGEEPLPASTSANYEGNLPKNFTEWLDKNSERIADAKSLPYFLADNQGPINASGGVAVLSGTTATTTTTAPTTTTASAGTAQTAANPVPTTQQGNTDILKLSEDVQKWNYVDDDQSMGGCNRLAAIIDEIEHYYGKNSAWQTQIDNNRSWLSYGISDETANSIINTVYKTEIENMNGILRPKYEAINHLRELIGVDKNAIHQQWREEYSNLIKDLSAYDFANKGYGSMYNKIEGAYNIYRLSVDPTVKKMGYGNISSKTPYNLFTEYAKAYPDWINDLPPKEFFDALSEFVPLVNGSAEGKQGCYFGEHKYVQIDLNDAGLAARLVSKEYRRMLVVHEYGHAFDYQNNLCSSDADLKSTFDKFKASVATDNGAALEKRIVEERVGFDIDFTKRLDDLKQKQTDLLAKGRTDDADKVSVEITDLDTSEVGFEEKLGGLSDCLQAAVDGHRWINPRGHEVKYFADSEALQRTEFFAHCCENYFVGNDVFEELQPELYEAMRDLVRKKMLGTK